MPTEETRPRYRPAEIAALITAAILLALSSAGCTFIGIDHPSERGEIDFGPSQQVRLCVLLDRGITREYADQLLDSWSSEAPKYGLYLTPVSYQEMPRSGFTHAGIMNQLEQLSLPDRCDRMIYFVNRGPSDYLYSLAAVSLGLPEVFGEVDDPTLTRGFVVADISSPIQLAMTPGSITRHEIYHLLGCSQHFNMSDCYRRIHDLKQVEAKLQAENYYGTGRQPFYPTWAGGTDAMLLSAEQVNSYRIGSSGFDGPAALAQ